MRRLSALMTLLLLIALTACRGGPPPAGTTPTSGAETAAQTGQATEETTTDPAANPTAEEDGEDAPPEPEPLPGFAVDSTALQEALEQSAITIAIRAVQETDIPDRTAYLDQVLEQEGMPAEGTLLILVFTEYNAEIRFAMGAGLSQQGLTVERMLDLVRNVYQPARRDSDPAGALAALVRAINQAIEG